MKTLNHTVIKHLTKKIKKFYTFRRLLSTIINLFSDFESNNIDNFSELILNDTTHFFRAHIKILTTKQE